jgi:hypothetical protein
VLLGVAVVAVLTLLWWGARPEPPSANAKIRDDVAQVVKATPEIANVSLVIESVVSPTEVRFHYEIENGDAPIKVLTFRDQTAGFWHIENNADVLPRMLARRGRLSMSGVPFGVFKQRDYNTVLVEIVYSGEVEGTTKKFLYQCRFFIQPGSLRPQATFNADSIVQRSL